jgi:hypothetical protein
MTPSEEYVRNIIAHLLQCCSLMLLHLEGRFCCRPLPLLTHLLKQLLVLLPQLLQSMLCMPCLLLALCQPLLQGFTLQP